jgi:hypothetical protein
MFEIVIFVPVARTDLCNLERCATHVAQTSAEAGGSSEVAAGL